MNDDDATLLERKRQLYRLAIARSDIAAAAEGCAHLLEEKVEAGHPLYWTLHNGIVVSYCRPFTRNKPYGPLEWSEFKTPASAELHQELLDLRNKCVAHSDHDMRKVFIVPEGSQLFKTNRRNNKLGTAIQNWALPPEKWQDVHELCMDVGGAINLLVEAELRVLYSGLYTPEPFELGLE